jgi:hypothetical protein
VIARRRIDLGEILMCRVVLEFFIVTRSNLINYSSIVIASLFKAGLRRVREVWFFTESLGVSINEAGVRVFSLLRNESFLKGALHGRNLGRVRTIRILLCIHLGRGPFRFELVALFQDLRGDFVVLALSRILGEVNFLGRGATTFVDLHS